MAHDGKRTIRELPSISSSATACAPLLVPATQSPVTQSPVRSPAGREETPPLDRRQLINRCLGRIELAERLIASFQTRFPNETGLIEKCLTEGDDQSLARQIHQLKGAAANVSAPVLHSLLTKMEQSARAGDRPSVVEFMSELYAAWDHFKCYLEAGAASPAAP